MKVLSLLSNVFANSVEIIRRTPSLVLATTVLSVDCLIRLTSSSKILVDGLKPTANTITFTRA
tara:strand:+ start:532 stop:720 length:189 start_codon:yes stop_codon:yes gene_type:complete